MKQQTRTTSHAAGAVRHAEKRRTGTCRFADRVAQVSLDAYRTHVPKAVRHVQKQTCVATIVAHYLEGDLQVMAMGVGTKFLSQATLRQEIATDSQGYGLRVRDCHAEVLARRAFRRQICLEIINDLQQREKQCNKTLRCRPILKRVKDGKYELLPNVSLHMYCSSAPCGNATLKKFTKMEKEVFQEGLGPDQWPQPHHEPIPAHSLRLGQFALLIKMDRTQQQQQQPPPPSKSSKTWPANQSDDWCPPGTSIVAFGKGSLHTCSDKICRWNILGLQGSLLDSLLQSPLYMSTLVVGRKFTSCICRRAICCRATPKHNKETVPTKYALCHPSVMGTGVYLDVSGVIDMTNSTTVGQDVRFNSSLCWVWWPSIDGETEQAECINGSTGYAWDSELGQSNGISLVSTRALLDLFHKTASLVDIKHDVNHDTFTTLGALRAFKRRVSPEYETAKDELLTKHRIFRQWSRREYQINNDST